MLRPRSSRSRLAIPLDGVWNFSLASDSDSLTWTTAGLEASRPMPVPASFNDITVDKSVHDHVGPVHYQTRVDIPRHNDDDSIIIYFGAVTHNAIVWADGVEVARHTGGYLPFEADITDIAAGKDSILLSVSVDNRLSWHSIPPGFVESTDGGATAQRYFHDFYNYAGMHRSVLLCIRPKVCVTDILITTDIDGTAGIVSWEVTAPGAKAVSVRIIDQDGSVAATGSGALGRARIENARLWQPGKGELYTLEIHADDDIYPQPFGIRTVEITGGQFLINGKPFYFRGYGRHEDNLIRGKGHDTVMMVHDFELMAWQGANSFRTSHYPYDEAVLDFADQLGIVVIDETAAVGINSGIAGGIFAGKEMVTFSPDTVNETTQQVHADHIRELIARDRNHPCVVLWSIANEPESHTPASASYFEPLAQVAREADPTRPVGYVNVQLSPPDKEQIIDFFDVVMLNRYYGWYWDNGDLASAEKHLRDEIAQWIKRCPGKPIIFTEYGPDALPGLHDHYRRPWSEEYQADMLDMFHRVFDDIPEVVGEQMWNFADFQTAPGIMRVGGNKKGMFTRDRLPKAAAAHVRERWLHLRTQQGN
ncbi:MAG: beta-glucuronidase [Actinomycetaceae bacterium]|nr:beta-glucuronidase [Actinomycetaceae bacterium]